MELESQSQTQEEAPPLSLGADLLLSSQALVNELDDTASQDLPPSPGQTTNGRRTASSSSSPAKDGNRGTHTTSPQRMSSPSAEQGSPSNSPGNASSRFQPHKTSTAKSSSHQPLDREATKESMLEFSHHITPAVQASVSALRQGSQAARQTLAPAPSQSPANLSQAIMAPPKVLNNYSLEARQRRQSQSQSQLGASQSRSINPRETYMESDNTEVTLDESLRTDVDQLESAVDDAVAEDPVGTPRRQSPASKPATPSPPAQQPRRAASQADKDQHDAGKKTTPDEDDQHDEGKKVPGSPLAAGSKPSEEPTSPTHSAQQDPQQRADKTSEASNREATSAVEALATPPSTPPVVVEQVKLPAQTAQKPSSAEARGSPAAGAPLVRATSPDGEQGSASRTAEVAPSAGHTNASPARSIERTSPPAGPAPLTAVASPPTAPAPQAKGYHTSHQPAADSDVSDLDLPPLSPLDRFVTWRLEAAAYSRPCAGSDGADMTHLAIEQHSKPFVLSTAAQRQVLEAEVDLLKRIESEVRSTLKRKRGELDALDDDTAQQPTRKKASPAHLASDDEMDVDGPAQSDDDIERQATSDEEMDQLGDGDSEAENLNKRQNQQRSGKRDQAKFAKPALPSKAGRTASRADGGRKKPPAPMPIASSSRIPHAGKFVKEVGLGKKQHQKSSPPQRGKSSVSTTSKSSPQRGKKAQGKDSSSSRDSSSGSETASDAEEPAPKSKKSSPAKKDNKKRAPLDEISTQEERASDLQLSSDHTSDSESGSDSGSDTKQTPSKKKGDQNRVIDLTDDSEPMPPPGRPRAEYIAKKRREAKERSKHQNGDDDHENDENAEPNSSEGGARRSSRRNNAPLGSYALKGGEYSQTTGVWRSKPKAPSQSRARSASR